MICCCPVWIVSANIAALAMGIGLFILAVQFSGDNGLEGTRYLGIFTFLILFSIRIYQLVRQKFTLGTFIDYKNSSFFNSSGCFQRVNLIPLLGNWYCNSSHIFLFTYAFKFAKLGGLNQGVVAISLTFISITNTILFYFVFNEKVTNLQIVGMILIIGCGVLLCLSASNQEDIEQEDISKSSYSFYALLCSNLVPLNFTLKHYLIRKYKGSYKPFDLSFDSAILENLSFIVFTIVY